MVHLTRNSSRDFFSAAAADDADAVMLNQRFVICCEQAATNKSRVFDPLRTRIVASSLESKLIHHSSSEHEMGSKSRDRNEWLITTSHGGKLQCA